MPIPWNEVWQVVLAIAVGVTTLSAACSWIVKLFNPYKKLKAEQEESKAAIAKLREEIEQQNDKYMELFRRDLQRFERNNENDAIMFDLLFALLEHARTNNSTGLMDEASEKARAYLIHRK